MTSLHEIPSSNPYNKLDQDPSKMASPARRSFCGYLCSPVSKKLDGVIGHTILLVCELALAIWSLTVYDGCARNGCLPAILNPAKIMYPVATVMFVPNFVYAGVELMQAKEEYQAKAANQANPASQISQESPRVPVNGSFCGHLCSPASGMLTTMIKDSFMLVSGIAVSILGVIFIENCAQKSCENRYLNTTEIIYAADTLFFLGYSVHAINRVRKEWKKYNEIKSNNGLSVV